MSPMETTIKRNMLEYACGRAIFCKCGQVMDCKRAVQLDVSDAGGKLLASETVCAACWDKHGTGTVERLHAKNYQTDVIDGRALFGRAKRTKIA